MREIAIIICWLCAIVNVVIAILNVRITYKRHKQFIELEEWIESRKIELIEKLDRSKNMSECTGSQFEIIAKAKKALIDSTNIETSSDEMACLDSFLFRCWQMGWLDKYKEQEHE